MKQQILEKATKKRILIIIAAMVFHLCSYYIPKLFNVGKTFISLATELDNLIPFVPVFIVFYVLAFVQWGLNYLLLLAEEDGFLYKYINAEIIGKAVCIFFFIMIPTTIQRPEVTGTGIFSWMTRTIYFFDTPVNLFPSMHCFQSWLCMRAAVETDMLPRRVKIYSILFTLGVVISTVCVKQHVFIDTVTGITLAELSLLFVSEVSDLKKKIREAAEKIR